MSATVKSIDDLNGLNIIGLKGGYNGSKEVTGLYVVEET